MSALVFLSKIQFCKDLCCCSSVDAALVSWKHPSRRHYSITQPWGYKASHMNCSLFIFPFIRIEHPIENWSLKCSMIFFFFFYLGGALHAEIYNLWNSCVRMNGISCQPGCAGCFSSWGTCLYLQYEQLLQQPCCPSSCYRRKLGAS